jgi:hypothetical protein
MPMYARLWVDILGDPKLLRAADEGAKNLVILPWLIAWAKRADASGRIETSGKPSNPREIARAIPNVSPRHVGKSLAELEAINVLERDADGCYRFTAWDYRNSGKTSDSKEAVAERVRKHRERKRRQRAGNESQLDLSSGNTSNALPVTDVTSKRVESREEREESREKRVERKSGVVAESSQPGVTRDRAAAGAVRKLPGAAADFGRAFYASAPPSRKRDVKQQLLATLNGGAQLRAGVKVRAGSVERLELKCREVIAEGVDDADKAIVVLLTKLADVSDDSPTERAAAELKRDEKIDEAEAQRRFELAMAWIRETPGLDLEIDEEVKAKLGNQPDSPIGAIAKRMTHRAVVLKRWTDAGEPLGSLEGAHTP